MGSFCVLGVLLLSLAPAGRCNKANKHKPWIETEYQGIVMENDNTVLLNPPLFALDKDAPLHYAGEICGFRVHSGSGSGSSVFEAVVLDKTTGEGLIRAREPLDCESQREHTFTVQAYDCGEGPDGTNSKKSHKATVHVRVNDVNEFSPVFVEKQYQVSVSEGRLFDRILRVEALDGDCSPQYSQICFYDIVTPNVPFAIDNDGNIKNTEVLDSRRQRFYRFTVTAFDCGKSRATADAEVTVEVKPTCKPGWIGWSKRVEYTPGSGGVPLFPSLHLETCEEPVWNIQATVELQTNHIGKGCDRDSYSDRSVRRLCGAVRGEVDLLPPPSPSTNWTAALPTLPSPDSSLVFSFNNSAHVAVVPPRAVAMVSGDHFTLQLWMKRGGGALQGGPTNTGRGAKREEETIVCNTVKNDDSFSHYSLSVHGCRLSLLYWPDLGAARPVKFLWKLEQVCDGEWHHFVVSVEFPAVTLYVDGVTFDPALIHDNGPLRSPTPRPRLFIGACWVSDDKEKDPQNSTLAETGETGYYQAHFRGLLAGVTLRPGSVEPHSVVECLYACREGLDFGDLESLGTGMKVHVNPSQSVLVLEGDDVESFNRAVQQVTYRNSLRFATPGVRPLKLATSLRCFSEEGCLSLRPLEGYLVVLQPDAPQISLSGGGHLVRPVGDFEAARGVALFPELRITCSLSHSINTAAEGMEGGALMSDAVAHTLDGCEVSPVGEELDPEREELVLEAESVRERGLELTNTTAYIALTGPESISVYEDVLRSLRYRLARGSALFERRFRLSCSEMNGRYTSNELTMEVNFLHSLDGLSHPSHLLASQQFLHPSRHSGELAGHTLAHAHRNSVVPGAATVIIVVCVGFLALMVVLGIFRIRSIHRRSDGQKGGAKEGGSEWDDSALTIIVNPMESYESRVSGDGGMDGDEEEEGEESPESPPGDAPDDQQIIIKRDGREHAPRRY